MTSVQGCKVDRSAGRSHLASGEPAGTATGERAAGRPNPASLVTPSTLVQYSGGNDLHEKTTPETIGVRRPFGTARIGGPDEQESRRTEEPDTENGRIRPMSEQPGGLDRTTEQDEHTFTEQIEIAAS